MIRPRIQFLERDTIERVIDEAYEALMDPGMLFATDPPLQLLARAGAHVDFERRLARIPARLIDQARKTVPSQIVLYDAFGDSRLTLGGDNVYYYPPPNAGAYARPAPSDRDGSARSATACRQLETLTASRASHAVGASGTSQVPGQSGWNTLGKRGVVS